MNTQNCHAILFVSPESWEHNFVSKHHYAIELARRENAVYFLNPPGKRNKITKEVAFNIFVIDYRPFLRGLYWLPQWLADFFCKIDISRIKTLARVEFDEVWSFDPYRLQNMSLFKAKYKIYFAADWHKIKKKENVVANSANIILSPSQQILESVNTTRPKYFVNHSAANYFFDNVEAGKLDSKGIVKVGYVGNLSSTYLNFDLLRETIRQNVEFDFYFVGEVVQSKLSEMSLPKNVFFMGKYQNNSVPGFLAACDILLLCYDTDRYGIQASNSHKIMEYLSSGKVVVSTRMSLYDKCNPLIVMPDDNYQLPLVLSSVGGDIKKYNSNDLMERRKSLARRNSYINQVDLIHSILYDHNNQMPSNSRY